MQAMSSHGKKPWFRSPTFWIFVALVLGVLLGGSLPANEHPGWYGFFKFLSEAFVGLIKGLIVPLLLSTIIVGIAQTGDLKAVGRMGGKALLYFEVVTTFALVIGLVVVNVTKPGEGLPLDIAGHAAGAAHKPMTGWQIAMHALPTNIVKHAAEGEILPIVVFATIFAMALTAQGAKGRPLFSFFEMFAQTMFKYTDYIMVLTPLGVLGSMASSVSYMAGPPAAPVPVHAEGATSAAVAAAASAAQTVHETVVATTGWSAVLRLLQRYAVLVGSLYLALAALIVCVFIPVMLITRTPVLRFIKAIKDPVLTAFSTASSEAALPQLLERLVEFGVPRRVAGFVVPAGYSFNLDGSTLYLVLGSVAIAQAAKVELSIGQQLFMMLTLILTSKGVAGVPRATLVIIAATADGFGLPGEAGFAMLLAVDAVMDMARTAVNVTGNGLASVVIAKWEGVFGSELGADGESTDPVVAGEPDPVVSSTLARGPVAASASANQPS